jgi:hypothetical protein
LKAARAHGRRIGLRKATTKIANQLERMAAHCSESLACHAAIDFAPC